MKILGPQFLSRFLGRVVNTHPALLPAFPGAHAVPDALGLRRQGDRLYRASRRCGNGHRADTGAGGGAGPRRRRRSHPARADQGRRTTAAGGRTGRDGNARRDLDGTKGGNGMTLKMSDGGGPIRRALISVYDKTGLADLARGLHEAGVAIVSTGSTAKTIAANRCSGNSRRGRHGLSRGARRPGQDPAPACACRSARRHRKPEHVAALEELGVAAFELVVVNLYPFTETVDSGASEDECVEQIDIGGPSMVRAAAKNHPSVAVVVDPLGYDGVLAAVRAGGFTLDERKRLASLAFRHTAEYDVAVATWMGSMLAPERCRREPLPQWFGGDVAARRGAALRGEPAPAGRAVSRRRRVAGPGAGRAAARQGDVLQQLHRRRRGVAGGVRPRADLRGDHQARQPVWHRDLVGIGGRRAPQGPRVRPASARSAV